VRICLVYDCLFPYTIGGAERWYRELALRLAAEGHDVTYVTLRQWDEAPDLPGVRVVAAGPRMHLYSGPGQRRILPPLVFGAGVLVHALRHGRGYDVVHTASFPYFSLLAVALARPLGRYRLVVDWHELWSRAYWREYLGPVGGTIGWLVQKLCLRVRQRAFCFAQLTAGRLRAEGARGEVTVLEGEYSGSLTPPAPLPADPVVVFAGRHIPEKGAPAAAAGMAAAARRVPGLRGIVFGDGPDPPPPTDGVETPGFVDHEQLERALARALCLLHPSRREGYGLVVVEAAALGVPSILVRHPDNAATELIEEGVNGFVVDSADPEALADAIVRVRDAGAALRESTAAWFASNARRLSLDASLDVVAASYAASARS
jgi:glycosyltransferase involved in cell wall biosynthesis